MRVRRVCPKYIMEKSSGVAWRTSDGFWTNKIIADEGSPLKCVSKHILEWDAIGIPATLESLTHSKRRISTIIFEPEHGKVVFVGAKVYQKDIKYYDYFRSKYRGLEKSKSYKWYGCTIHSYVFLYKGKNLLGAIAGLRDTSDDKYKHLLEQSLDEVVGM